MEIVKSIAVTTTLAREHLTAARTYYVRTDGSDSNDGLTDTSGGAFLTIQHAVDVVCDTLDINSQQVVIQVADGAYNAPVALMSFLGSTRVTLRGNTTTPANVTITTSTGNCFTVARAGAWQVEGFKLSTTGGNYDAIGVAGVSDINLRALDFGASTRSHIVVGDGAVLRCTGPYSISGSAAHHYYAGTQANVTLNGATVTLTGTPAFSVAFANAQHLGLLVAWNATFSGAASGVRYNVFANSVIFTNGGGANFFPGSAAGSSGSGGQYMP